MTAVAVCNKCCGLRPLQVTDGYLQFEGPKGPDGYHVLYIDEYEYEDAMSGGWHRCCCPHYLAREAAAREERSKQHDEHSGVGATGAGLDSPTARDRQGDLCGRVPEGPGAGAGEGYADGSTDTETHATDGPGLGVGEEQVH